MTKKLRISAALLFVRSTFISLFHTSFSNQYIRLILILLIKQQSVTIWVRHSGGPPFRRSAIPGYYCYNNPNPNPILTLTLS